jgi:hypothetical protein
MKIEKLQITKDKLDVNLKFYFFLKYINKINPSDRQIDQISENIGLFKKNISDLNSSLLKIFSKSQTKSEYIKELNLRLINSRDVEVFEFSLDLYRIKDLLLQEAKVQEIFDSKKLYETDPLSLEYDNISVLKPYKTRVSGALLSLLFFEKVGQNDCNFISKDSFIFVSKLAKQMLNLKKFGLESNQIFMLMFSESINQSIISDSGSNYENRILSVLNKIGIKNIRKIHDKGDKSTEYDFFFEINGKSYGIGAKRTLRERYKQFIKTKLTTKIDFSIQITLGLDLFEEKAKTIVGHDTYIFVADEIYQTRNFLKKIDRIYSVKDLSLQTLKNLK